MKIVQHKKLVNKNESEVNEFLKTIPAGDIINLSFNVYGFEGAVDEWVTIFYRTENTHETNG